LIDMQRTHRARKRVLAVAGVLAGLVVAVHRSAWPVDSLAYQSLVRFGVVVIAAAVAGRVWAWVALGNRRRWQMMTDGPYSLVRHPLYACSILGTFGIGTQTGSFVMAVLITLPVLIIFTQAALVEERDMGPRFGAEFEAYCARTWRFVPNPSNWSASKTLTVDYRQLARSVRDASAFGLAIPIMLLVDWARGSSLCPSCSACPSLHSDF
jgi:protein-S-isoprenylcysteine O-methyltransferase Ste14